MDLRGGSSHFNLMEHLGCDIQKHFSKGGGIAASSLRHQLSNLAFKRAIKSKVRLEPAGVLTTINTKCFRMRSH